MKKFKNVLKAIYYGVPTLLAIWFILSWLEVISKNLTPNPEYFVFNLFELFF